MPYLSTLELSYIYNKSERAIYIRTKVSVTLPDGEETLSPQGTAINGADISKEYRAVASEQPEPNIYTDLFLVKMIEDVVTPPGETDRTYAEARIEQDLAEKQAEFYSITVDVKNQDGSNGGSNSGEINQSGEIDID